MADVMENLRRALISAGARAFFDPQCRSFRDPVLAEALTLWRANAGSGIPPRRAMTPQTMRAFLTKVALFERIDQPFCAYRYRARLTGPEFTRAYADMTGKFLDDVVPKAYFGRWKLMLDAVLAHGAPFRCITVPEAFNRDHSVLEMLLAPLADDAGKPNQVLFVGNFERGKVWAEVEAEEAKRLGQTGG
jgi:PAS domain